MASSVGTAFNLSVVPRRSVQAINVFSSPNSVSLPSQRFFPSINLQPSPKRSWISCAAKQETVDKVCDIVRKQLVLAPEVDVAGHSKFSELGADSLDTVEIVMGLEEAFGISVEEQNAQSIVTVQDAAEMIDKLVEDNA